MKKTFCLVAVLASFLLIGCKQEQSELDLGAIADNATVSGRVTYSLGQDTLSSDYVAEVIKPATGRKVYIDVPKSSYQAGAQGSKIFEGIIDSAGYFRIDVPVKSDGLNGATLRYEEFTAERTTYLKMQDGKPVFEKRMCKFETPAAIASLPTLLPGANKIGEESALRYDYTIVDMKDYAEKAVFSGSLLLPYEVSYRTGAYKQAANCKVEITIQDGEDVEQLGAANAEKFTYGTTTNANGEFAVNLPIKNLSKGFYIVEAVVLPTADVAFTHYTDISGKSVKVEGAYRLREPLSGNVLSVASRIEDIIDGIECAIGEVPLVFEPGYVNGIVTGTEPAAWTTDLAGWVFGESAFRNLQARATLTGSVALAKETAFGVGTYDKSMQTVRITGSSSPYDRSFEVLTQSDGSFAFEIPVAQEGVNPGVSFSIELVQPTSVAFTHYKDLTSTVVLKEGSYTEAYALRTADADWNELGDRYYLFVPATVPSTYTTALAGWFKAYDNDQIYTATQTITAKVYIAKETAYAVGGYAGASGHRVAVTVNYGTTINGSTTSVDLVAPVNSNGTLTLTIPAKNANAIYEADNFALVDRRVENFTHYKKGSKTATLNGQYNLAYMFENKEGDWNNKYTLYYRFTPTGVVDSYHTNLAGWYLKDGYTALLTASGKAYIAVEKSFGVGAYQAAADEIITVHVAELSADLQVPVSAAGVFTVSIPAKFSTDEYTLSATTSTSAEIDDFIHYRAEGKKMALTGTYQPEMAVRATDSKWNDMGTYYFKFNNSGASMASTYTKYLAGWVVVPTTFTNTDVEATGSIRLAAETGFWKGTYDAYAKKRVEVSYTLNGTTIRQVVLTDEDGTFTCKTYREFSDDAPTLSVSPLDIENITDFKHYYHITSPTVMNVTGYYTHYTTDRTATAAWNTTGTHYYRFTPTTTPTDWTTRLVGWYIVPQKKSTANFALYAQKAILSTTANNHEAIWTNAGSVKAQVTVAGMTFDMPVSGRNLTFSLPLAYEIEVGSTMLYATIRLTNETGNTTAFTYYEDPSQPASTVIYGNYTSANNITNKAIVAESGNKFELKQSAKLRFTPQTTPTGWSLYSWDVNEEVL